MRGLLIKDFYTVSKALKNFLIIVAGLIVVTSGDITFGVTCGSLFFATLPLTSLAYDEHAKWDNLAKMMPYSKEVLVLSKFITGYIGVFAIMILSTTFSIVFNTITNNKIDYSFIFTYCIILFSGAIVFLAINLLVAFKFGVEKGRIVFIFVMAIVGFSGVLIEEIGVETTLRILEIPAILILAVAVVINLVVIKLCIKIKYKEN